jgi:hypothetical protein
MTIQLPPEIEAAVAQEAERLGTTPQSFVEQTLRARLSIQLPAGLKPEVAAKLNRLLSIARPCGISLSDEDLSSERLYD